MSRRPLLLLILTFISFTFFYDSGHAADLPEKKELQSWIEGMKAAPRGPFKRLRWFCNDGSILPPKPYACREHGGGVQHGEWSDRTKLIREHNYQIATLLADLWPESFYAEDDWRQQLKQILLEQYLIDFDDGWIFRQARYYRGAVQAEDENWHGQELLLGLVQQSNLQTKDFLLLREAVRLLPHGQQHAPLTEMRQLATEIEENDPEFSPLRIKLHGRPEFSDAEQVRLATPADQDEQKPYLLLAELIEQITQPNQRPLTKALELGLGDTDFRLPENEIELSSAIRFARSNQLLKQLRDEYGQQQEKQRRLDWLSTSLDLEHALYQSSNQLLGQLSQANRRQRLAWIELGLDGLYGIGFLSPRQWQSQKQTLHRLLNTPLTQEAYHRQLQQLSRISRWSEQQLQVQFEATVSLLTDLDPLFTSYFQQRLRASPLLPLVQIIDSLLIDSQQLLGARQALFGQTVAGLRPLNPGLARGRLEIVDDPTRHQFSENGIYLLPETIAELPPVAGILTRDAGNSLSHIQLLARNLGIPNLAVSAQLLDKLRKYAGDTIVVAVSPGGVVRIEADSAAWRKHFRKQEKAAYLITPDLGKLNLKQRTIQSLDEIRAADSGRIAGPKGANLGELKQIYQNLVPGALVIPFGRFRELLDNQTVNEQSLFDWMQTEYRRLALIPDQKQLQRETKDFLAQLRQQIIKAPLEADFLVELEQKLTEQFGPDGSYGVFVRSDTNVEDLPNFTGAGLNKTVPHVVGFDNIVAAIRKVWASPFSERAYSWRQAHMRAPEHVYASILLMKSVPADKSGVLATSDLLGGKSNLLHVAANEGVGGAVSGQRAEEILIDKKSGSVQLLSQASALKKRVLLPDGGIEKITAKNPDQLLTDEEITILRQMAARLPARFPSLRDSRGNPKPADIEFGFLDGEFVLFQIRPLAESKRVKADLYLQQLDSSLRNSSRLIDLTLQPLELAP